MESGVPGRDKDRYGVLRDGYEVKKMSELNDEYGEIIGVVYGRADLETCEVEDEVWEV